MRSAASTVLLAALLLTSGCEREKREFKSERAESGDRDEVALSSLSPGATPPQVATSGRAATFEGNAYHVAQGKRLFTWFNCNGCHAMGGGDSGPPLMDDKWIYGGTIENIVATIREGRPNGMPSFRGKIPDDQIWEIAAFVRSMGGNLSKNVAPQRNDDLNPFPAENRRPPSPPTTGGQPLPASRGTQ
ncbi:c-type cytochrome [Mesorhizobium sp. BR1-1-16]|uniref:c-type cytochrome n=1 Tax=Mesorhizobium sp. BR1-1-16 TaxID=2876653 RepID=UPI001CCA84BA|nr:c-type cytochrome [Mesorhizobium sp. BR1-1-16]MBZ9936991.1 c-type cytochrome [Mesorhizobium sp. BR1-1-16]